MRIDELIKGKRDRDGNLVNRQGHCWLFLLCFVILSSHLGPQDDGFDKLPMAAIQWRR